MMIVKISRQTRRRVGTMSVEEACQEVSERDANLLRAGKPVANDAFWWAPLAEAQAEDQVAGRN